MNTLIHSSIQKAISYQEYNKLVQQLVVDKKTTGDEQTEERIAFTKLNASRMKRLDKTLTLTNEVIQSFNSIQVKQTWLVLLESWCADGAQTIPILNKIAEVGYDLNPIFQRKGIMSEALNKVINFGFNELGLDNIEAYTHIQNENSKKLLEKNGFIVKIQLFFN